TLPIAAVLAVICSNAQGQTFTQPATGTTGNWSTPGNWSPGVPVSDPTTAITFNTFGGNANTYTLTNDLGAFTVNSFTFNSFGTGSFTTTQTTALTFGGTTPFINFNGSENVSVLGTGIVLASPTTIGGSGTGALTFGSI